jgi:hypothetical protein
MAFCASHQALAQTFCNAAPRLWRRVKLGQLGDRISNQLFATARDKAVSTPLRSITVLDVLDILPKVYRYALTRAPRIHGLLTRLATKSDEKCGLTLSTSFFFAPSVPLREISISFGIESVCPRKYLS